MKKKHIYRHIKEMQTALIHCIIWLLCAFAVCYFSANHIIKILLNPITKKHTHLIFTGISDGFLLKINTAIYFAIIFTIPFLLYKIYTFCKTGFTNFEARVFKITSILFVFLFISGAVFAYFLIIPFAVEFLLSFFSDLLIADSQLKVVDCIGFVSSVTIAFGFAFQMPILIFLLDTFRIIRSTTIKKYRKHSIVGIFIIAAVLTPPDVASQVILATILILLMELGFFLIFIFRKIKG